MRSLVIAAGVLALAASTASSQVVVKRGEFAVAPFGGYLVSQSLFEGPINLGINMQGGPLYGVQGSLPLSPSASLIGSVGYSSGDLKAGIPIIGGVSFGSTSTTIFDASVELRADKRDARVIPIVELGGGAIRRAITVAGITAKSTDFQVSGGLGVDMPVASNMSLRFMAKDYWGAADFGSIGSLEAKKDDVHAIALSGGLRIAF